MATRSGRSTCRCRATTPSAPHRMPRHCGRCVPRAPSWSDVDRLEATLDEGVETAVDLRSQDRVTEVVDVVLVAHAPRRAVGKRVASADNTSTRHDGLSGKGCATSHSGKITWRCSLTVLHATSSGSPPWACSRRNPTRSGSRWCTRGSRARPPGRPEVA